MCGRFKMLTMDEVTEVIRLIQMHVPFNCLPDWPAGPDVRPGTIAPVIVPGIGELDATELRWGFEASWANRLLFNTRIETALGDNPGLWEDPISRADDGVLRATCDRNATEPQGRQAHQAAVSLPLARFRWHHAARRRAR